MSRHEFAYRYGLPFYYVRLTIDEAARPADVGVLEGGTSRRKTYTVTDPDLLRVAVLRHMGPAALTPSDLLLTTRILSYVDEAGFTPEGMSEDEGTRLLVAVRGVLETYRAISPTAATRAAPDHVARSDSQSQSRSGSAGRFPLRSLSGH